MALAPRRPDRPRSKSLLVQSGGYGQASATPGAGLALIGRLHFPVLPPGISGNKTSTQCSVHTGHENRDHHPSVCLSPSSPQPVQRPAVILVDDPNAGTNHTTLPSLANGVLRRRSRHGALYRRRFFQSRRKPCWAMSETALCDGDPDELDSGGHVRCAVRASRQALRRLLPHPIEFGCMDPPRSCGVTPPVQALSGISLALPRLC